MIILGDFNLPDIVWNNLNCEKPISNLFCDFVYDNDLLQFISSPTHDKGNILDLVLSKSSETVLDVCVHNNEPLPNMKSDHNLISFSIPCSIQITRDSKSSLFNFNKGDYISMNEYLASVNYTSFYDSVDVEYLWSFIKSLISKACELYVPKSNSSVYKFPKWFNGEIIHKVHKVRSLRKKWRLLSSVKNTITLKEAESNLHHNICEAKSDFESSLVQDFAYKHNNRIHSYIRSFMKHSSLPTAMYHDSEVESTSSGKASIFNSFFHSAFNNDTNEDPLLPAASIDDSTADNPEFDRLSISVSDVFNALAKLVTGKAMGIDRIPNIVTMYEQNHNMQLIFIR